MMAGRAELPGPATCSEGAHDGGEGGVAGFGHLLGGCT